MTELVHLGATNSLTDVEGISVGHFERLDAPWRTGATVVVFDRPSVAAVEVRGGGPGTRETDVLAHGGANSGIDALAFAGSSAYGLDVAGGVMRAMQRDGRGLRVGPRDDDIVPIVPGAIIFDLGRGGSSRATADSSFGEAAYAATSLGAVPQGSVGAGVGAQCGGVAGGVGSASAISSSGAMVAALVVVNSFGSAFNPKSGLPWGVEFELDGEFEDYLLRRDAKFSAPSRRPISTLNTVVGVVASNLALTSNECKRMAVVAHDGLARSVRPAHTFFDGDTFFAASTGRKDLLAAEGLERLLALSEVFELASEAVARAIVHGIGQARAFDGVPAWCLPKT